jgi:hypothetical protein
MSSPRGKGIEIAIERDTIKEEVSHVQEGDHCNGRIE